MVDIAKQVCNNVTSDLVFGIGNPEEGNFTGYIKNDALATEANQLSRKLQDKVGGDPWKVLFLRAKIASAAGVGNCGECGDVACSYLFTSFGVGPIKKWLHPPTAVNHDNHCFVSFQCGGTGEEWVVDPWAYIVKRNLPHSDRSKFGVHKMAEHQAIANELYLTWGEHTAPTPSVIFQMDAKQLLDLDAKDMSESRSRGFSRMQVLQQNTMLAACDEQVLVELKKSVSDLVGDAVKKGTIPAPSNPRASLFNEPMSICS